MTSQVSVVLGNSFQGPVVNLMIPRMNIVPSHKPNFMGLVNNWGQKILKNLHQGVYAPVSGWFQDLVIFIKAQSLV